MKLTVRAIINLIKNNSLCIIGLLVIGYWLFSSSPVEAVTRRKLPGQTGISPVRNTGGSSAFGTSAKLRADRKAVILSFSGLTQVTSVTYMFTYDSNGKTEGSQGVIRDASAGSSRELLFGTCSSGVCRYHSGIKNARIEVTAKLKNGKTYIKKFKIKV